MATLEELREKLDGIDDQIYADENQVLYNRKKMYYNTA